MSSSEPSPTDRIAREAARLIDAGSAATIGEAIRTAVERLGLFPCRRPSEGRVRQHLQAMAMQALGEGEYRRGVRDVLSVVEQLMTALSERQAGGHVLLVGRAARGLLDGPAPLHVRLYTDEPLESLAQSLVDLGYDEPTFETINTRFGRLNRLTIEDEGIEIAITRCLPSMRPDADRNLFSDEKVATATLAQVRTMLG